jgi:hypothetical protein
MTGTPTSDHDRSGGGGTVDLSHLLLVGAGISLPRVVQHPIYLDRSGPTLLRALWGSSARSGHFPRRQAAPTRGFLDARRSRSEQGRRDVP